MATIDKLIEKFYRKPIPNDITYKDVEKLAIHFGCIITHGGRHGTKVVCPRLGILIPIPRHGNIVKEGYVKQLKKLFDKIEEGS